jgi:C1A family cysteine protease
LLLRSEQIAQLPPSFIINDPTPVGDQGQLGSCTANAADNASKIRAAAVGAQWFNGSRLAVYYLEREHDGDLHKHCPPAKLIGDCGSQLSVAAWVLQTYGVAPETSWPYDIENYNTEPPESVLQQAAKDEVTTATRLDADDENTTISNIKAALVQSYPVIFGINCYAEIEDVGADGNVPMPTAGEEPKGGHALCIIGYDDNHQNLDGSKGAVLLKNSWGTGWGCQKNGTPSDGATNGGYGWLSYPYFRDTDDDVGDCWAIINENDFPALSKK